MHESNASKLVDIPPIPPILCTISQASYILARGTTKIYELIGSGEIEAVRSDRRTLIIYESLRRYAAKLAKEHRAVVKPRGPRKPPAQPEPPAAA